ncbi:MAG: alcohol dehydrogenase catalytic domain-containing protein, partial [Deltaproteobacteria bacterium]|nr:alcohol dehydrogenase catalytic domain-containing protein [Deltaproteobacteria bacterium]
MRALVFDSSPVLRNDYPDPHPPAGESLIRVRAAGICGTDLELAKGYMGFHGIAGHEFVGEVVADTGGALTGKRIAGEINSGCNHCDFCRANLARHCPNRTVLGILERNG